MKPLLKKYLVTLTMNDCNRYRNAVLYLFLICIISIRYQDFTFLRTDMISNCKHAIQLLGIRIVLQVLAAPNMHENGR